MTTRFKNAIDALVYAFFNDTLAKGTCAACAVANIITHGMGSKVIKVGRDYEPFPRPDLRVTDWRYAFCTHENGIQQRYADEIIPETARKVIELTGYSIDEMARVEKAFETSTKIWFDDYCEYTKSEIMQDQYNGLCAVVDVLCEIEGIEDRAEYKKLFSFA